MATYSERGGSQYGSRVVYTRNEKRMKSVTRSESVSRIICSMDTRRVVSHTTHTQKHRARTVQQASQADVVCLGRAR